MQTATKERPILFSAPMVRAILAGHKTQTRRVVKPQPPCECAYVINANKSHALCFQEASAVDGTWTKDTVLVPPTPRSKDHRLPCPYGKPGDRLWVREAWAACHLHRDPTDEHVSVADNRAVRAKVDLKEQHLAYRADGEDAFEGSWRSPIHMPRWASRITLEVVNVRVERVQDISEADAEAEGCTHTGFAGMAADEIETAREQYARLWDSIHGPGSWSDNPWVWVVEFARVDEKSAMQGQTEAGRSKTSVK